MMTHTESHTFDMYAVGRTLTPEQQSMYFRVGAEIQSMRSRGFLADATECHEIALWALETVEWKSMKAAKALYIVSKQHGAF